MTLTRRDITKLALGATAAGVLQAKPNSKFHGVQIGAITYSFRSLPSSAEDVLKYLVESGISSIELMSDVAENYAGIPKVERPRVARGEKMTPEQQQMVKEGAENVKKWRTSVSMDKYKALRKMYNDAGVDIAIFKLPVGTGMSDEEVDYIFHATKALGAHCITMELPTNLELTKRAGQFGEKHKIFVGYHNHMQVNESSWNAALAQSKYNSINLDVGHFTEAISKSPIPFIQQNHSRISSFHLKDKMFKTNGGGNRPWGSGETPLKEVLRLMAKEKYKWPANIELEYDVPKDSTVTAEVAKCVKFCQDALA